ncbi:MAG TPA: hypothetical protein VKE70_35645 [Candidatus Solibacter sp.]|nr:hypothetical protein [Candidatus Solibacter sp.]
MARSAAFERFARTIRIARFCDRHGLATREELERAAALEAVDRGAGRREFLAGAAKLGVVEAIGAVAGPPGWALVRVRDEREDDAWLHAYTCNQPGHVLSSVSLRRS